jgi:hypothetical protein
MRGSATSTVVKFPVISASAPTIRVPDVAHQSRFDRSGQFHNPALADPIGAKEYLDREWNGAASTSRYEWLFTYDVLQAEI